MACSIHKNFFQQYCNLSQNVQKLQNTIKTQQITPHYRIALHKQLENTQTDIEKLSKQAVTQVSSQFKQIEAINSRVVTLYKEVEEQFEKYEISLISKGAVALGEALEKGNMLLIAQHIDDIKSNIHFLFKHRRPSLKHRKIINLALKLSSCAGEMVANKHTGKQIPLVQFLKKLLQDALETMEEDDLQNGELSIELYEIAMLLKQKKEQEAYARLKTVRSKLSIPQRKKLDLAIHSPKKIIKLLLQIAEGECCVDETSLSCEKACLYVLQA